MRLLFIMDPVSTIVVDADTTFALMRAAQAQGHDVLHCEVPDVFATNDGVYASARPARCAMDGPRLGPTEDIDLAELDVVFVRKDPPFDARYLWLTQLLERVAGRTAVINEPRGLRAANEKLYAYRVAGLSPESLISSSKERIKRFVADVGGHAVIKDIDGHGGSNVFRLSVGDDNVNAIIEMATDLGRRIALVQRYLPEVRAGDKRILLLDGRPLGAINRVPRSDDLRSNIHVGGVVHPATVTVADKRIIESLAPALRADGLWFVGIDVIGEKLTEVNVTSPTGIQQMSRHAGRDLAADVIEWATSRAGG